jgi:hypothetical protein
VIGNGQVLRVGDQWLRAMNQPLKKGIRTHSIPDLPLPDSSPHPRVQVRKYGEQKLFISPGLLPEAPTQSGPPKPDPAGTPKDNHGKSRWPAELCQRPALTLLGKLNQSRQPGVTSVAGVSADDIWQFNARCSGAKRWWLLTV